MFPVACLCIIVATPIALIASIGSIKHRLTEYVGSFLVLETFMIGVFCALDLVVFYVFFEAGLIPMFIIIGVWGGVDRIYASFKFFLYTLLGSVLMLIAMIAMLWDVGTSDVQVMLQHEFSAGPIDILGWQVIGGFQTLCWLAFFASFAVKMPMWPVHTWLPDAHVQAPTAGSVILAAVLLKLGGYGFLRFSLPMFPVASELLADFVFFLSVVAIIYTSLVAMMQEDMKKLIAYSSIAHMGFVTLGTFLFWPILANTGEVAGATLAITGAMVQMISHGLISGAMFLCVGVMYDRMHSREIADYGGVVNSMPTFAAFMVLFAMANAGLPATSGFVGEFWVILASFKANFWIAFLAATTLILGASYTLWMVKRVLFGEVANDRVAALTDITAREFTILSILAAGVLLIGLWPQPLADMMQASIEGLVEHIGRSKL